MHPAFSVVEHVRDDMLTPCAGFDPVQATNKKRVQ